MMKAITSVNAAYDIQGLNWGLTDDLFNSFIEYTDCRETTVKGYISYIRHFIKWVKEKGLNKPTREDIKLYRQELSESDLSIGTQQQYFSEVKRFFKWTEYELKQGRIGYPNIAENLRSPKTRNDIHKKDALSRNDVPVIADSIDRSSEQGKRLYAMYLLCITCGLRTIEIHRANIEDLKVLGGISYLYIQGKGHDDKDTPVEVIPEVKAAIEDYLSIRAVKPTPKTPLFTSTSNRSKGGRIAAKTISTMLKEMLVSAGYDSDRLTAHSLRHTSGTGAYMATGNLFITQQHQRHADPKTTEIYIHAQERRERHTEQQVYDYYFNADAEKDLKQEAKNMIDSLDQEQIAQVIQFIKAIK